MLKKIYLLLLILIASVAHAFQEKDSLTIAIDTDSIITVRQFEKGFDKKYTGDAYNYDSNEGDAQNLLTRALDWVSQFFKDSFGFNIPPNLLKIVEYSIYALMSILVIYLLIRFFINERMNVLFTKKAVPIADINLSEEHIENIDIDILIKDALKTKDYRLAVRYQYLKALKLLSLEEIISWHFDKTNSDYLQEIENKDLKEAFQNVSYAYEYIWYGELEIDKKTYGITNNRFAVLNNLLKN